MTRPGESNAVRQALDAGERVFGTFLMEFASPGIARIADTAGAQFIFWDMQHTGWSATEFREGLQASRDLAIVPGVRVPGADWTAIGQALDAGARMIMVPAVADATTAETIVAATRYPVGSAPGTRAVTFSFGWDAYDPPDNVAQALADANDDIVVFVQIETVEGLENVEAIAQVDGVDVLWVGDNDLAASLGVPGDFEHPRYLAALERVAGAAADAGKAAGFTTASVAAGTDLLSQGYRILAYGNDIKVFRDALRAGIAGLSSASDTSIGVER